MSAYWECSDCGIKEGEEHKEGCWFNTLFKPTKKPKRKKQK